MPTNIQSGKLVLRFLAACAALYAMSTAPADEFKVQLEGGEVAVIDARLVGTGNKFLALERRDGHLDVIHESQIVQRTTTDDPPPYTSKEVLDRLTEEFGNETFRGKAVGSYVVGIVFSSPLDKVSEAKATAFLTKGLRFMESVESVFENFARDLNLRLTPPRYPMVLIVFETDAPFNEFTRSTTKGRGISAENILGFYSPVTNRLAIRMTECHTFEVPLHEAIHQFVYNRGLLQRLAPIPAWFNEGIATGFEGNGEKINSGPLRINTRYARSTLEAKRVDWKDVVGNDRAFRGDDLAGEAYAHAWSLHWFLVSRYRKEYADYVRKLGEKAPLSSNDSDDRHRDVEQTFGKSLEQLQQEFPQTLNQAVRKQNLPPVPPDRPGHIIQLKNLAEVEVHAIQTPAGIEIEGRARNISTVRPMSFYITVETEKGVYADWYFPNLASMKVMPMPKQRAVKPMMGREGDGSDRFQVRVQTVAPASPEGISWKSGKLPSP